jgi:hypothetical protein
MASEILGLFTSPEEYQMRQQQAQQNRALDFAQLDPMQKASYGAYQAGRGLADIGGRLFGMEDPQLRKISMRQQMISGTNPLGSNLPALDFTDPVALRQASAFALQRNRDPEFAQFLQKKADEVELNRATIQAKMREKPANVDKAIQIAQTRADLNQQIGRLEQEQIGAFDQKRADAITYLKDTLAGLKVAERQGQIPDTIEIAKERARLRGLEPDSVAYNEFVDTEIGKLTSKADKVTAYGSDRNAIAQGEFNKDFADLTQEQKKAVNVIADQEKRKIAEAGVPKVPGQGKEGAKDIPKFRDQVLQTVDPFRKTITSTDQGLQSINDSLKTGNFISFKAARTQLAKALDSGTLSRKDIEDAGGDPSILGGTIDWLSTKITATPSPDTQNKMKATLTAINKLARQKGQAELDVQRKIATRSGFDQQDVDLIFDIPEFRANVKAPSAARTNETIPSAVEARITQIPNPSAKAPAPPVKGQKQTRTLKSGKTVTVETE